MKKFPKKIFPKVSFIGSGNIGGTCAHLMAMKNIADIVLFDIVKGLPQGKALDIAAAISIEGGEVSITGTNTYSDISDSDVIIITAGLTRTIKDNNAKPPLDRAELLSKNAKIIKKVAENIKKYSPNAFVIVITNPLDAMTWLFQKLSGLNRQMVVGMAGGLDSSRFCYFLGKELGVSPKNIHSFIIGEHGNNMVPLIRFSKVNDVPLDEFLNGRNNREEIINNVIKKTREAGGEIIKLMRASAYFAPAAAALDIALSYLQDKNKTILCSTLLNGEYDVHNLCVGVPVVIGSSGVKQIEELNLQNNEKEAFQKSIESIQTLTTTLKKIIL
jgi:malate dehydrogenase